MQGSRAIPGAGSEWIEGGVKLLENSFLLDIWQNLN
jgi:hypothetical protein